MRCRWAILGLQVLLTGVALAPPAFVDGEHSQSWVSGGCGLGLPFSPVCACSSWEGTLRRPHAKIGIDR